MKIALLFTMKPRDLRGLVDLKMKLEKYGHEVRVFNVYMWHFRFLYFKPHVLVLPDLVHLPCINAAKYVKERNGRVLILSSEGVVGKYTESLWAQFYKEGSTIFHDKILAWGEKTRDILLKYGEAPENVHIFGNIRFDKYHQKLLSRKDFCEKYKVTRDKKIVMYVNDLVFREGFDTKNIFPGFDLKNFDEVLEHWRGLRGTTIDCIFKLVKNRPDVHFILKLHPLLDDDKLFKKYLKKYDLQNVTMITAELSIEDLLNVTDVVIHWSSTASGEAWFLNKPTISLNMDEYMDFVLADIIKGSDRARTYEDLHKTVDHYLKGGKIPKKILEYRKKYIRESFYKIDGKRTEAVAKYIDDYTKNNEILLKKRSSRKDSEMKLAFFIKKLLGIEMHRSLLPWKPDRNEMAFVTDEEIMDMEAEIKARSIKK